MAAKQPSDANKTLLYYGVDKVYRKVLFDYYQHVTNKLSNGIGNDIWWYLVAPQSGFEPPTCPLGVYKRAIIGT